MVLPCKVIAEFLAAEIMTILVNAYSTLTEPPNLQFSHALISRRDLSDPELFMHLNGFIGYILNKGDFEMFRTNYYVVKHIQRVKHHISLQLAEDGFNDFGQWAMDANVITFLPDGTIRDPSGFILVNADGSAPDAESAVPYPQLAWQRKAQNEQRLRQLNIHVPDKLPPVIAEPEVCARSHRNVMLRALGLFIVALRAESMHDDEIPVNELRAHFPTAFASLTAQEKKYLQAEKPDEQQIANFIQRYEALNVLQWALGMVNELIFPAKSCQTSQLVDNVLGKREEELLNNACIRPVSDILDALDFHYRLHWVVRQATIENKILPCNLCSGVVYERYHALNWLVQFQHADWDDLAILT